MALCGIPYIFYEKCDVLYASTSEQVGTIIMFYNIVVILIVLVLMLCKSFLNMQSCSKEGSCLKIKDLTKIDFCYWEKMQDNLFQYLFSVWMTFEFHSPIV